MGRSCGGGSNCVDICGIFFDYAIGLYPYPLNNLGDTAGSMTVNGKPTQKPDQINYQNLACGVSKSA